MYIFTSKLILLFSEYIDFWLDNIHCYGINDENQASVRQTDKWNPPVLIIGTKVDKLQVIHFAWFCFLEYNFYSNLISKLLSCPSFSTIWTYACVTIFVRIFWNIIRHFWSVSVYINHYRHCLNVSWKFLNYSRYGFLFFKLLLCFNSLSTFFKVL